MQLVLVAGGAGFIGSHLCRSLLKDGYKVVCVDNLITGDKKNIEDLLVNPEFKFVEQDITKSVQSSKFIPIKSGQSLDYIFHLASPASPNKKSKRSYINHPVETLLVNSVGTFNLLELAKKENAKFLYASSSEIYGDPKVFPQNEEYFGNVNPNGIRSCYDEGKRFGEALTFAFIRKYKVNARVIRIFNTYGQNMHIDDGRVVSNFISQAVINKPITVYGDGSQTRSFCYIDDMIDGLKRSLFIDKTDKEVINLGNPIELTIIELAGLIKKMTASSSEIVFEKLPEDDPKRRRPDIAKAKRLLSWEPKVPIAQGLEKTIKYFKRVIEL
ncbi:MAG: NAD-dependent dehydratase [Candidatus Levybacteria bacterium RIFCSPHIGHO2_02_FULL_37_13]|nr:MAG: NAD-dependent dehydratase [Candidatus Levybacteria bacterium RIFCSPHIGHO2_02_FULL_37_13]OGH30514.1 MAG: NAD-dependent dehydratase [Candidatus Levybacteria bacterium RIFCSPHIGHO2_12_FULL_37_9]OGH37324.1 MAG: NAD-dependent dehydratase [Candidatus Levybacteria bacterium RIFCSPLOWO2_01_FULL_37_26]